MHKVRIFLWVCSMAMVLLVNAQGNKTSVLLNNATINNQWKPVKYNAFGMGVFPYKELMIGGNHISYKKIGFGLSWRISGRNLVENPGKASEVNYDTAAARGWFTGNVKNYYAYTGMFNFVIPVTKKWPVYAGIGATRFKSYKELQEVLPNQTLDEPTWLIDQKETWFKLNFTAGTFIPITNRIILNIAYDHLPQTVFVGIAISSVFNYEDIDMW